MATIKKLTTHSRFSVLQVGIFAGLLVVVGVVIVLVSHASGYSVSIVAANGQITAPATVVADASASAGGKVTFNAPGSATPTPTPSANPSGQANPTGNLTIGGHTYKSEFSEDFTKDAAVGSWGTSSAGAIVYNDNNAGWYEYPDGWSATYTGGGIGYEPSQVLSVHDGELDFNLHTWNGSPVGANPSPNAIPPGGSGNAQTYGAHTWREKVTNTMQDFYSAWLLWPTNQSDWCKAETDFPERNLGSLSGFGIFGHNACSSGGGNGGQWSSGSNADMSQWHTYTETWGPGYRQFYIDNSLIDTDNDNVYGADEYWQLQTEPSGSSTGSSGHIYVDWVDVYSY